MANTRAHVAIRPILRRSTVATPVRLARKALMSDVGEMELKVPVVLALAFEAMRAVEV